MVYLFLDSAIQPLVECNQLAILLSNPEGTDAEFVEAHLLFVDDHDVFEALHERGNGQTQSLLVLHLHVELLRDLSSP